MTVADLTKLIDLTKIAGDTQKMSAAIQSLTMNNLFKGYDSALKATETPCVFPDITRSDAAKKHEKPPEVIEVPKIVEDTAACHIKTEPVAFKKSKGSKLGFFGSKKKLSAPSMTDMRLKMSKKSAEVQIGLLKPFL